jgi:ribosomal protein S18 acetylase RimI-like enzyme
VSLNAALFQEDAGQRDPFMNLDWPHEEGHDHFTKHVREKSSLGLLAEVEGEAVGYLVGYVKGSTRMRPVRVAELESIYVRQAHREQGVGRRLVGRFLAWARERGAERVSVTAYAANESAIAFYQRIGFKAKELTLEMGL